MSFTSTCAAGFSIDPERVELRGFGRPVRPLPLLGFLLAVPPQSIETSILLYIRMIPMAAAPSRQALRRWGNSLGIRLPAAIAREAQLQEDQSVELSVVEGGVLIRPVQHRLSLAERLAAYEPMAGEPTEALAFRPLGAEVIE